MSLIPFRTVADVAAFARQSIADLKDWGTTLRVNAAACALAPHLYAAKRDAFQLSLPAWDTVAAEDRAVWVRQAKGIVEELK